MIQPRGIRKLRVSRATCGGRRQRQLVHRCGGLPARPRSAPAPGCSQLSTIRQTNHVPSICRRAGAKVAICELPFGFVSSDSVGGAGGTCVLRGCVPKKLMVYAAGFTQEFRESRGFGCGAFRLAEETITL